MVRPWSTGSECYTTKGCGYGKTRSGTKGCGYGKTRLVRMLYY